MIKTIEMHDLLENENDAGFVREEATYSTHKLVPIYQESAKGFLKKLIDTLKGKK